MAVRPSYSGKGIVNLMSSIINEVGLESPYSPLDIGINLNLEESKNIVLMIVDGLGFNYLKEQGSDTLLNESLRGSMTSVFLPSTGSAVSTFFTGLAPQQHTVTGWYVHLQEIGIMSRFLPFSSAVDWNVLGIDISSAMTVEPILTKMKRAHIVVQGEDIVDSVYSKYVSGSAMRIGFSSMGNFFEQVRRVVSSSTDKTYTHAYWPQLDATAHILGMQSQEASEALHSFDDSLRKFVNSIQGTDTKLVITGDHGFNDVTEANTIRTRDHPELMECLTLPLCGDTRTVFCYVRPSKIQKFERYVTEQFGDICDMYRSEDLIKENWFGLFDPHPRLMHRVGDYTLVFKEGHAAMNCFPDSAPPSMKGHHGGITEDEMMVPLIVIDC